MIKLHQAKLSDAFDVLYVLNTALEKKLSYNDNAWGVQKFTTSEVLPYIESGELYIVIEIGGDITGVVVLQESDENIWGKSGVDGTALYIHKLASLSRGLGTKMIDASEKIAKKKGKSLLRLDCSYDNKSLYKYYLDMGFIETTRILIGADKIGLLQKSVAL